MEDQLIDFGRLLPAMRDAGMDAWAETLPDQLEILISRRAHGDLPRWQAVLKALPALSAKMVELKHGVSVKGDQLAQAEHEDLRQLLLQLSPWRKGPYKLHGITIDTEWRSDWKWQRVSPHLSSLEGRVVLDVGCGSGYHAWRIAGEGARLVIGIDPSWLFLMQFNAVRHFAGQHWPVHLLPMGIEDLPHDLKAFDTVFSMGVLYHRRSPVDHLLELKECLKPGGELVLETLVIEGDETSTLVPQGRYAKMRNVWFIPSVAMLTNWLQRTGFRDVRVVDINRTTTEEQRSTRWMQFESLPDYLDPDDPEKTIEGYPGPLRATLIARSP